MYVPKYTGIDSAETVDNVMSDRRAVIKGFVRMVSVSLTDAWSYHIWIAACANKLHTLRVEIRSTKF